MFSALAPARRRLALGLLVAGATAALVLIAAAVAASWPHHPTPAASVPPDQPGPVIVVPGYGGATSGLDVLAAALRAAGKDTTVMRLIGDGQGDLHAEAVLLASHAKAALARTGAPSVDVVGYSAGGVVARLFVEDHGGRGLVRRVVTLGSPHHGTELAEIGGAVLPVRCPLACQQLRPDSTLLAGLNGADAAGGPQRVSIWTTDDDVVLPPTSAVLPGALNFSVQSVCPNNRVNHGGLPGDPNVAAMVVAELSAAPVAVPRVSCARPSS